MVTVSQIIHQDAVLFLQTKKQVVRFLSIDKTPSAENKHPFSISELCNHDYNDPNQNSHNQSMLF